MTSSKSAAALAFAAALGVGAASAADLGARPYTKAPAYADALYNWSGFYVGGHVGGSSTSQRWTNTARTALFCDLDPGPGFRPRGTRAFAGVHMRSNSQAAPHLF